MILRLFEKIAASLLTIFIGTMDQFEWKLIFFYPDFGIQFNFFFLCWFITTNTFSDRELVQTNDFNIELNGFGGPSVVH